MVTAPLTSTHGSLLQCILLSYSAWRDEPKALLTISLWTVNHQSREYNGLQIFTRLELLYTAVPT